MPNSNLYKLVAMYGSGEKAAEAMKRLIEEYAKLNYRLIQNLAYDTRLPENLRQMARDAITGVVKETISQCVRDGNYYELYEIAYDTFLPENLRQMAEDATRRVVTDVINDYKDRENCYGLYLLSKDGILPKDLRQMAKDAIPPIIGKYIRTTKIFNIHVILEMLNGIELGELRVSALQALSERVDEIVEFYTVKKVPNGYRTILELAATLNRDDLIQTANELILSAVGPEVVRIYDEVKRDSRVNLEVKRRLARRIAERLLGINDAKVTDLLIAEELFKVSKERGTYDTIIAVANSPYTPEDIRVIVTKMLREHASEISI